MATIKKLEEEIARTTDPVVRKQLQELVDSRKQKHAKIIKEINELFTVPASSSYRRVTRWDVFWFCIILFASLAIPIALLLYGLHNDNYMSW